MELAVRYFGFFGSEFNYIYTNSYIYDCNISYTGWTSALKLQKDLSVDFDIVAAYDVNVVSNEVYEYNHSKKPSSSSIESLSVKILDTLKADIWVIFTHILSLFSSVSAGHDAHSFTRGRLFINMIAHALTLRHSDIRFLSLFLFFF